MPKKEIRVVYTGPDEVKGFLREFIVDACKSVDFSQEDVEKNLWSCCRLESVSNSSKLLSLLKCNSNLFDAAIIYFDKFNGGEIKALRECASYLHNNVYVLGSEDSVPIYLGEKTLGYDQIDRKNPDFSFLAECLRDCLVPYFPRRSRELEKVFENYSKKKF